jgi:hypothetical protein
MRNTQRFTLAYAARVAERKRELALFSPKYKDFNPHSYTHPGILRRWEADGPPPMSEYKLTFGKHRGKRLEEVPDSYLVKYLIPRSDRSGLLGAECPLVVEAIKDFRKRHPDIKSQAGKEKTKPLSTTVMHRPVSVRKSRKKHT